MSLERPLLVLLVEDSQVDAHFVRSCLKQAHETYQVQHVDTLAGAELALEKRAPDAVLLDLNLPDASGSDAVSTLAIAAPDSPIVVITGSDEQDVEAMRAGAQDYLRKRDVNPAALDRAIRHAVQRQRLSTELRKANARLKELQAFRESFLNNVAHDMANPITVVRLNLGLIEAGTLDAEGRERLEAALLATRQMASLVQDLRDVSLLFSGQFRIHPRPIDLCKLVRDVAQAQTAVAAREDVTLRVDAPAAIPLQADELRLQQVLTNLVTNAVKFSRKGGTVRIEARRADGRRALVRVVDDGRGIAPEKLERLFRPFAQVHDDLAEKRGTGLGLFIAKGFVEAHRGHVGVESDGPDRGSTFWFDLPLATADARPPPPAAHDDVRT